MKKHERLLLDIFNETALEFGYKFLLFIRFLRFLLNGNHRFRSVHSDRRELRPVFNILCKLRRGCTLSRYQARAQKKIWSVGGIYKKIALILFNETVFHTQTF